jgi:hypothetical protein
VRGNYEPVFRSCPHRADDRCNGVDIRIGISLRRPQFQRSNGLGQPHLSHQGPGGCNARVYCCRRKSPRAFLSYRLLSVKCTRTTSAMQRIADSHQASRYVRSVPRAEVDGPSPIAWPRRHALCRTRGRSPVSWEWTVSPARGAALRRLALDATRPSRRDAGWVRSSP